MCSLMIVIYQIFIHVRVKKSWSSLIFWNLESITLYFAAHRHRIRIYYTNYPLIWSLNVDYLVYINAIFVRTCFSVSRMWFDHLSRKMSGYLNMRSSIYSCYLKVKHELIGHLLIEMSGHNDCVILIYLDGVPRIQNNLEQERYHLFHFLWYPFCYEGVKD